MNWIQEVRPDFTKGNEDPEIRAFLDRVVSEVWERWDGGEKEGEEGVDLAKVCRSKPATRGTAAVKEALMCAGL